MPGLYKVMWWPQKYNANLRKLQEACSDVLPVCGGETLGFLFYVCMCVVKGVALPSTGTKRNEAHLMFLSPHQDLNKTPGFAPPSCQTRLQRCSITITADSTDFYGRLPCLCEFCSMFLQLFSAFQRKLSRFLWAEALGVSVEPLNSPVLHMSGHLALLNLHYSPFSPCKTIKPSPRQRRTLRCRTKHFHRPRF